MKAVMSFWNGERENFIKTLSFTDLCIWALSVYTIKAQFGNLTFFCDKESKELFINELELPFDVIRDELYNICPEGLEKPCWALGKIKSFYLMNEPFIHFDGDVFLLKDIDKSRFEKPVIAQSSTGFKLGEKSDNYQPIYYKFTPYLPDFIRDNIDREYSEAGCFGVFGGTDLDLIKMACNISKEICYHPKNKDFFLAMQWNGLAVSSYLEEYIISTVIQLEGRKMDFLLEKGKLREGSKESGYVHLAGNKKREPQIAARVRIRLNKMFPEVYKRIENVANARGLRYD